MPEGAGKAAGLHLVGPGRAPPEGGFAAMKSRAFTIVELMLVVTVLGVLLSVAIPAYAQAKGRSTGAACAKNRQLFDQAKQLWMIDNGKSYGDGVYFKDLLPEYIAEPPVCPGRGHYELHGLEGATSCSVHGQ